MLPHHEIFFENKKAVSPMIAYILLIVLVLAMSPIVYSWLKSYVSQGSVPECPDDVAVLVKTYSCDSDKLEIELLNNGFFSIDGISIKATTSVSQDLATQDLSEKIEGGESYDEQLGIVLLSLEPGKELELKFEDIPTIFEIEITPAKYVKVENKEKLAYCDNARIRQKVDCVSS